MLQQMFQQLPKLAVLCPRTLPALEAGRLAVEGRARLQQRPTSAADPSDYGGSGVHQHGQRADAPAGAPSEGAVSDHPHHARLQQLLVSLSVGTAAQVGRRPCACVPPACLCASVCLPALMCAPVFVFVCTRPHSPMSGV